MAVKIPSKLGSMSPTFQKAWYKRNKMSLPAHLTGSVKQASKEVKPSERVKKLQAKSIQAYGATKGTKVGGEHGSEDMRDTIAPLTRDQHSKVQAAERAAKAAAKAAAPAKPKKPLTKDERMAAIRRAVTKAKAKDRFDVPTVDPDDADHDDLRDVHNQMHIRRGYNEEVELDEAKGPDFIDKINAHPLVHSYDGYHLKLKPLYWHKDTKKKELRYGTQKEVKTFLKNVEPDTRGKNMLKTAASLNLGKAHQSRISTSPIDLTKIKKEQIELDEVTKHEAEKALGGPVKTRTGSEPKGKLPLGFRRARNLARKAMKTVKESTTEVLEVNEMNHGKKLAKMIMAKQSQHPIAQNMGEENIVEQDDMMEKKEMAQTQLHFIKYAAEEILEFIDMGGEIEEWYQNKLSKVQSEVESLHSYIEGEKRRTGMVEETEQVDEKAPPGAKFERMVKHIKKGYAKDGLTPQEKSIAYATAWKAYGKKNEEVEEIEEGAKDWKKAFSSVAQKNLHQDTKKMQYKVRRRDLVGLQPKVDTSPKVTATTSKRGTYSEEVEQVNEMYGGKVNGKRFNYDADPHELENDKKLHRIIASYNDHLDHDEVKAIVHSGGYSRNVKVGKNTHRVEHDDNEFNEEVVTEAEGTVAVTPKEKALAAHHGDPKKITYGDVIKARLKSAAAKKMGK